MQHGGGLSQKAGPGIPPPPAPASAGINPLGARLGAGLMGPKRGRWEIKVVPEIFRYYNNPCGHTGTKGTVIPVLQTLKHFFFYHSVKVLKVKTDFNMCAEDEIIKY